MAIKAAEREGKRSTLSVRLTPEGRARLDKAASASGRSLAQEVEMRLENSFAQDVLMETIFGGNLHSRNVMHACATAMRRIEMVREARWVDDYATLWTCRKAVEHINQIVFGYATDDPIVPDGTGEQKDYISYLSRLAHDAAIEACRDLGLIVPGPKREVLQRLVRQKFNDGEPPKEKPGQ